MRPMKLLLLWGFYLCFCLVNLPVYAAKFAVAPLSAAMKSQLRAANVWNTSCPTPLSDLRLISVGFYNGNAHAQQGEIIMHKSAAAATLNVFKELYHKKFPFAAVGTLLKYQGKWQQAEHNNVSYGFICPQGLTSNPNQSSGIVLTINPILNPQIDLVNNSFITITPAQGIFSVNRTLPLKGSTNYVKATFAKYGFVPLPLNHTQLSWKSFIYLPHAKSNNMTPLEFNAPNTHPVSHENIFSFGPLPYAMKNEIKRSGFWHEGCPVDIDRLNLLHLTYYDFQGQPHLGQLIVLDTLAPFVTDAFKELFKHKYPLEPLHAGGGHGDIGGTSSYNCRAIVGQSSYSLHSFGVAIDINVSRNPYIGSYDERETNFKKGTLVPNDLYSFSFLDRDVKRHGMNEKIVPIMKKHGLIEWGGNWQDRIDYMHFQLPTNITYNIVRMDKETGEKIVKLVIQYPSSAKYMSADSRWIYLYRMDPELFAQSLQKYFSHLATRDENKVIDLVYEDMVMKQRSDFPRESS